MEGKTPREIKGWVVKRQRVLVTPFRDATAMEAEPTQSIICANCKFGFTVLQISVSVPVRFSS